MIYIRKNGIFYENNYDPNSEDYLLTKVKSFIPYLTEYLYIDSEITLKDIFDILDEEGELINVIFGSDMGNHPLHAYIEDINKECLTESREDMEAIELSWVFEQFDYKKFYDCQKEKEKDPVLGKLHEPEDDEVNEISIYIDVHGIGDFIPTEQEKEIYKNDSPEKRSYAIEFTPLYRMKHIPIKLNKEFIINEEDYTFKKKIKSILTGEKEFTVFEAIGALLSEITFAGLPEERDQRWEDIVEVVDEYKEKMEEEEKDKEEKDKEEKDKEEE